MKNTQEVESTRRNRTSFGKSKNLKLIHVLRAARHVEINILFIEQGSKTFVRISQLAKLRL